ncbi:MAG: SIMPL domain-containing protein [Aestuariivirgaceae bacterium]
MNTMIKVVLGLSVAGMAFYSTQGFATQTDELTAKRKWVQTANLRPLRVQGHASVTLNADLLSVDISVAARADSIDEVINRLKQRRSEIAGKVEASGLSVTTTGIKSLNVSKPRRDGIEYRGEMQLGVEIAGFDDPLTAIAQIADDKVTRIGSLRYGFSEKLQMQNDLCEMALADARQKAVKRAEATGRKLGKLLEQHCNNPFQRHGQFSSNPRKQLFTTTSATFELTK